MLDLDDILLEKLTARSLLDIIEYQRKNEEVVKLHPNGFIQLSLSPNTDWRSKGLRLHIWTDRITPQKELRSQIHDHIFDIESHILCGKLINTLYNVKQNDLGEYVLIDAGIENLKSTNKRVSCNVKEIKTINEGEKYSINGYEFHTSSAPDPLTVTVMSKINIDNSRLPNVLFPANYSPKELEITRSIDQKFAWKIIDLAQEAISKRYK